jgi:hypothetical protein
MIQTLQGVKITPQGGGNRFSAQDWPNSFAFGGWIYNLSATMGFSEKPTEIRVSVVLETTNLSQTKAKFDIQESDLRCDAGDGGLSSESWYDFDIEGYKLTNFILHSYDFSIEYGQKILNLTFKDYSVILDKIYIGLFKKQGFKYPHMLNCQLALPIRCLDCEYTGSAVTGTGYVMRDIGFGCYAGNNGKTVDLFANSFYSKKNVFNEWQDQVINLSGIVNQFDLNGGYLIIGTESATEERCNSAPNINYSFIELLAALRKNGISIGGSFPTGTQDSDFIYRANHNGTLREVMQNWCSDLGYAFYFSGRSMIGLDLKSPIDITELMKLADPNSSIGQTLASSNTAIVNFNSKTSLDNTFRQSVVVDNVYPMTQREVNKSVKRYVGVTPLHPICLNDINSGQILDTNVYGTQFQRRRFETPWFDSGNFVNSYFANFYRLDGRSYSDLDAAIALSNYNDTLRDIFVAQRALYNAWSVDGVLLTEKIWRPGDNGPTFHPMNNAYCRANFAALGMFPILEIYDSELKSNIILDNFKNAEKDGIANINIDQQYFRVFLGYYYENVKQEIVTWEKSAAGSMYKYGVVTKGILTQEPFVPPNLNSDISPNQGFYGSQGLVYSRMQNSFIPETQRYNDVKYAPFVDTMLWSGFVRTASSTGEYYNNNNSYNPFIPPGFTEFPGRIPTGLWMSTLDNMWGTNPQLFEHGLSFVLTDPCAQQYTLDQGVQQILTESDQTLQDWRLEYFRPIVNPDLSTIYEIIQSDEFNFENVVDEVLTTYVDQKYLLKKECKKLHILIIPDTRGHPNIDVRFTPMPVNKINQEMVKAYKQKLYESDFRKNTTETPSICSLSLLDEMCRSLLTGGTGYTFQFSPPLTAQQSGCVILEDKNNYMLEGFSKETLFKPNSRSLEISITKNPDRRIYPTLDSNGDYYYSDLDLGMLLMETATVNTSIVYPIQSFSDSVANYSGIYSSEVLTEYRIPALNKVFGEPVNMTNNNAASVRLISNPVDNSLNPILDPLTNSVKSYVTIFDGDGDTIVKTPEQYYEYIKTLNNYNLTAPMKEISLSLAGSPSQFGSFNAALTPQSGLQQISLSVTDQGVKTDMTFADRPKVLPRQETILNKIGARIKGVY